MTIVVNSVPFVPRTALAVAVRIAIAAGLFAVFPSACIRPPTSPVLRFPPPPAKTRVVYLGRLDETPLDEPIGGAFLRWLHNTPTFLQTPLTRPHGIAAEGHRLFVCDAGASAVVIFDFEAQKTLILDGVARPVDIALDADGRAYVADAATGRIGVYDRSLRFLWTIDPPAGPFRPTAIAVAERMLHVADAAGRSLRSYDLAARQWLPPAAFDLPLGLPGGVCLAGTRLWLADALDGRVCCTDPPYGHWKPISQSHRPMRPRHLAADAAGRLVVADAAAGGIQLRDAGGQLLLSIVDPEILPLPTGVCLSTELLRYYTKRVPPDVDARALLLVTNQSSPPGVALFAYAPD